MTIKSYSQRIAAVFIFLSTFAFSSAPIFAATNDGLPAAVYVTDLRLLNKEFAKGAVVTGVAVLKNGSKTSVSDLRYKVMLVGGFGTGHQPTIVYDETTSDSLFLNGNEEKTITFSYRLPSTAGGSDLGIRVQAQLATGLPMGWRDERISVSGTSEFAEVVKAKLSVAGKDFTVGEGPMVRKGDTPVLTVTLKNSTSKDITVTPHLLFFKRSSATRPIEEKDTESVLIKKGAQKEFTLPLSVFEYAPSVYVGRLEFRGRGGVPQGVPVEFRYIIEGPTLVIHSVSADKGSAKKGEVVTVEVAWSRPPYDILTLKAAEIGTPEMTVTLIDGNGRSVGQARVSIDGSKSGLVKTSVPVTISTSSENIKAQVSVSSEKGLLASYEAPLSNEETGGNLPATDTFLSTLALIGIIFIALVIVLACLGLRSSLKRKKEEQMKPPEDTLPPPPPSMPGSSTLTTLLIIFATAAVLIGVLTPLQTYAWTVTDQGSTQNPDTIPVVFINSPIEGEVLNPGQTFYFDGYAIALSCANSIEYGYRVTYQGQVITRTSNRGLTGDQQAGYLADQFSFGPFIAPTAPGTYRIDLDVTHNMIGQGTSYVSGYQQFTVAPSTPGRPTLSAGPVIVTQAQGGQCGGAVDLSWTAPSGATGYRLYRSDDAINPIYQGAGVSYADSTLVGGIPYTYHVVAENGLGSSPPSNSITRKAICTLVVDCQANPTTAYTLQDISWDVSVFGGAPPFQYAFDGTDNFTVSGQSMSRTFSALKAYATPGIKTSKLTVSSSDGQSIGGQSIFPYYCKGAVGTPNVTILQGVSSISCSASPQNPKVGDTVTWRVDLVPLGTYSYSWSGTDGLSGSAQTITKKYTTAGVKNARVSAAPTSQPASAVQCSTTVTVQANPNYQEI